MGARTTVVIMASLALSASILATGFARAQGPAPSAAVAQEARPIGKIFSLKGSVTIEHAGAVVVQATAEAGGGTKVGDLVYKGDVVLTGADSAVSITFTDASTFNLASNARIVLNEFVYDPNGKSNSTLFSLTKGTFTFIAGKVAKTGDMKVETPVATMGIRGTTPRVEIAEDGTVSFSTLIEEKKIQPFAVDKGRGAKQRQVRSGLPSDAAAATPGTAPAAPSAAPAAPSTPPGVRIERKAERPLNLNICRGC